MGASPDVVVRLSCMHPHIIQPAVSLNQLRVHVLQRNMPT